MPIVVGESVNFLLTKFTTNTGQIYPQGVNLLPIDNPCFNVYRFGRSLLLLSTVDNFCFFMLKFLFYVFYA